MSSDKFFPVTHFSFVLHKNAATAATRLETVGPKIAMQVVEFSNSRALYCCKEPYEVNTISRVDQIRLLPY